MIKTTPPFLNPKMARTGAPIPKFKKAVEKIFKYSKMPISGAKKFQAEKKYLSYAKEIAKDLKGDKIRPVDLVKISRRLGKQGILKSGLAKYVEGHLLGTGGGKILTSKMITESGVQGVQKTKKSKKEFNVHEFHEKLAKAVEKRILSEKPKIVESEVGEGINKIEIKKTEEMPKWGSSKSAEKPGATAKKINSPGSGALRVNTSRPAPYALPVTKRRVSSDDMLPKSVTLKEVSGQDLSNKEGSKKSSTIPSYAYDVYGENPEESTDSTESSKASGLENNDIDE